MRTSDVAYITNVSPLVQPQVPTNVWKAAPNAYGCEHADPVSRGWR
jgi:hypothetical protein